MNTPSAEPSSKPTSPVKSKILFGIIFLLCLGGAIAGISLFSLKTLPIYNKNEREFKTPITTEGLHIESVSTQWNKNTADNIKEGDLLYFPSITLTLGDSKGKAHFNGFFTNSQGQTVGDGTRFYVVNGKFYGENVSAQVSSSVGYEQEAHFRHYSYSTENFWHFVITQDSKDGEAQIITQIPIPPTTQSH